MGRGLRCWLVLICLVGCGDGGGSPAFCVEGARRLPLERHPAAPFDLLLVFDSISFAPAERARVADETVRLVRAFASDEGRGVDVRVAVTSACADGELLRCEGAPPVLRFGAGEGQPWDALRCALDVPPEPCAPRPLEAAGRGLTDDALSRPDGRPAALLVGRRDACDGDPSCVDRPPTSLRAPVLVVANDVSADEPGAPIREGGCGAGEPEGLVEATAALAQRGATVVAQPVCAAQFDAAMAGLRQVARSRLRRPSAGYRSRPEGCRGLLELTEEDPDALCLEIPGARLRRWAHGRLCELPELHPTALDRRRGWLPEGAGFFFDDYTADAGHEGLYRFHVRALARPAFVACAGGAHHSFVHECATEGDCAHSRCDPVTGHCRRSCETNGDCGAQSICLARQPLESTDALCASICEPVW